VRIVTHCSGYRRIHQMFQHIAGCVSCHYWQGGLAITNLRTVQAVTPTLRGGAFISVALCMSPCRSDHIIPRLSSRVWRMVSGDSGARVSSGLSC
jgi:hypothetical protein